MAKSNNKHGEIFGKDFKIDYTDNLDAWQLIQAADIKAKGQKKEDVEVELISQIPKIPGTHTLVFQNVYGDTVEVDCTLTVPKEKEKPKNPKK